VSCWQRFNWFKLQFTVVLGIQSFHLSLRISSGGFSKDIIILKKHFLDLSLKFDILCPCDGCHLSVSASVLSPFAMTSQRIFGVYIDNLWRISILNQKFCYKRFFIFFENHKTVMLGILILKNTIRQWCPTFFLQRSTFVKYCLRAGHQ